MSTTIYTDDAIILAERAFGTADKIVTLYTRGRGLVKAAAFGCRRPNSPLAGGMQPLVEITVTLSAGAKVDTVRQYAMKNRHTPITAAGDLSRFAYAALFAEAAAALLPEQSPDEKIYDMLTGALAAAETRQPQIAALAAVVQLLNLSGWGIELAEEDGAGRETHGAGSGSAGGNLRPLIDLLGSLDWRDPPSFSVRRRELDAAEQIIVKTVTELTGSKLKAHHFLRQIK